MIDWTKPVRTKGSKTPVKILSLAGPGNMSVVGYLEGDTDISQWYPGGGYSVDPEPSDMDLENVPERAEYFIESASVWGIGDSRLQVCVVKQIKDSAKSESLFGAFKSHKDAETIARLLNAAGKEN